jgi:hypothetical protein
MIAPRHLRLARDLGNMLAVTVGNGEPVEPAFERIATRLAEWEQTIEEQGREEVRAYARRVADEERERLATYRRQAIESLDPSRSASAAAEYALRAACSSAVVVHLSVVGSWQP